MVQCQNCKINLNTGDDGPFKDICPYCNKPIKKEAITTASMHKIGKCPKCGSTTTQLTTGKWCPNCGIIGDEK